MADRADQNKLLQQQLEELRINQEELSRKLIAQEHRFVPMFLNVWQSFSNEEHEDQKSDAMSALAHWIYSVWWKRTALLAGGGLVGTCLAIYTLILTQQSLETVRDQNKVLLSQASAQHNLSSAEIVMVGLSQVQDNIFMKAIEPQDIPIKLQRSAYYFQFTHDKLLKSLPNPVEEPLESESDTLEEALIPYRFLQDEELFQDTAPFRASYRFLTPQSVDIITSMSSALVDFQVDGLQNFNNETTTNQNSQGAILTWLVSAPTLTQNEDSNFIRLNSPRTPTVAVKSSIMHELILNQPKFNTMFISEGSIVSSDFLGGSLNYLSVEDSYIGHTEITSETVEVVIEDSLSYRSEITAPRLHLGIYGSVLYKTDLSGSHSATIDIWNSYIIGPSLFSIGSATDVEFYQAYIDPSNDIVFSDMNIQNLTITDSRLSWSQLCNAGSIPNMSISGVRPVGDMPNECPIKCDRPIHDKPTETLTCSVLPSVQ